MSKVDILAADNRKSKFTMGQTARMVFSLIWRIDKAFYPAFLATLLLQVANPIVTIFIPKFVLDLVEGKLQGNPLLMVVGLVVFKFFVEYLTESLQQYLTVRKDILYYKLPMAFAQKSMKLQYSSLENPDVLDLKERALFPLRNFGAAYGMINSALDALTHLINLLTVVAILLYFSWIYTLIIVVLSVISLVLTKRFMKLVMKLMEEIVPLNRRYGYMMNAALEAKQQKNLRVYPLNRVMIERLRSFNVDIYAYFKNFNLKEANTNSIQAVLSALGQFITYSFVAIRIFNDHFGPKISVGQFSLIVMASEKLTYSLNGVVNGLMTTWQMLSYLQPFCEFMSLPEDQNKGEIKDVPPLESLEFRDVCFTYPNTEKIILDHLSFSFAKGEKLSIVGLNNAGKSTMVKLICRLYEPDFGQILWNGKDIQEYDYTAYMDMLSVVFQDFALFPFTIYENIDCRAELSEEEEHADKVRSVLEQVKMLDKVKALPLGMSTYLDKSLHKDATEFSGGERQKLAIARSLYKQAELVILDEPTAALDPLAEAEVYENFYELTQGKTAIFISHRMSSSLFCDKILLLQDGKVQAFDSHKNLMQSHNLYKDLFMAQAENYR